MDQVRYFRNHLPRCIAGFNATPFALSGVEFDGHGMHINSVFALTCSCGSGQHFVHGFSWINPDNFDNAPVFLSPLFLECTARSSACPRSPSSRARNICIGSSRFCPGESRPNRAPTSVQGYEEHAAGKLGKSQLPQKAARQRAAAHSSGARPPSNCGAAIFWRLSVCN